MPCGGTVKPEVTQISLSARATRWRSWSWPVRAFVKRGSCVDNMDVTAAGGSGYVEDGAANWLLRKAGKPVCCTCAICVEVGPNVDCSRKRAAAAALTNAVLFC